MPQQNRFPGLELKENLFENVPHVIIGNKKPPQVQQLNPPMRPPQPPQRVPQQPQPIQPKQPESLVDKLKKYTLIVFTILVLGTAVVFVLKEIIGRFF